MRCYLKTYPILMIFLIFWFALPVALYGQDYMPVTKVHSFDQNETSGDEQDRLDKNTSNFTLSGFSKKVVSNTSFTPPVSNRFKKNLMTGKGVNAVLKDENLINLYMNGNNNNVNATQEGGKNNIMNLGVVGNSNSATYKQFGSNNYIKDRIVGDNKHREVVQEGDKLGIYNQGMQTIPMIIKQRGQGMKIRITGSPPGK